ncbi:hypothetical protein [Anabaena sp. FACHB-83]|uniref:hypothetical protein n=1 Tax=Anabaena sp. FACHB-83 TaxID=2692772 RepID=UPI001A7EEC69|nr:hypothetical protein [Anabaena sp. FACHB-83]
MVIVVIWGYDNLMLSRIAWMKNTQAIIFSPSQQYLMQDFDLVQVPTSNKKAQFQRHQ